MNVYLLVGLQYSALDWAIEKGNLVVLTVLDDARE